MLQIIQLLQIISFLSGLICFSANLMDKVDCNGLTPIECSAKYQSNTSSAYKILHIFEVLKFY